MLCITKPPPKESIAKRPDNLPTIFFDVGDRVCVKSFDLGLFFSSLSNSLSLHHLFLLILLSWTIKDN